MEINGEFVIIPMILEIADTKHHLMTFILYKEREKNKK